MAQRLCFSPDCSNPVWGRKDRIYCSKACNQRMYRLRHESEKPASRAGYSGPKVTKAESVDGRASARRGNGYRAFCKTDWPELLATGKASRVQAVEALETSGANISRWMAAYVEDKAQGVISENHEPVLLDDLGSFTRRYFPKMLVPRFHLEWEADIDAVVGTGQRLLLLAPQRFGKSEMLIRYCMKRIAADPNISIGWVSKTADLAERMVGYVRQNLDHNTRFIEDVLGPGGEFAPANRSGLSWTNGEFTISNRTEIRKSPTMKAIGVGGTIVGQDFDLLILDDPQDRARCMSATQRQRDAEWLFTDFLSRKEDHTGVAFIMSRQHMNDLPGLILEEHIDDWEVRVYQAHDPFCTIAENDVADHHDCLLWPEKRTWKWLLHQKRANEAHFQRNYMNDPKTDATTYITVDEIDKLKDHTRRVGEIPSGSRMIAGIDPAEAKPVAAVLWGYDGIHRHIIDALEAKASVVGLRYILATWPGRYGVREFAFEKNMAGSWLADAKVDELVRNQRLVIHQFYTSRINKNSNAIGPVAMFQKMRTEPPGITVPWAQGEGHERIERLLRSWLKFDPGVANSKHADDDLTMASWFPQTIMDGWERPQSGVIQPDYEVIGDPMGGY